MEFWHGAGKCGLMVVTTDPAEKVALQMAGLRLHGVEVEIVDSYKYLGIEFSEDLSLLHMVAARAKKAKIAAAALTPLFSNIRVSMTFKRAAFLARLQPVLSFGGELLGMQQALVKPLQLVMGTNVLLA